MIAENLSLSKILFLDIETASLHENYDALSETEKKLWDKKSVFLKKEEETSSEMYNKAGIYAEFGKIICISVGFVNYRDNIPEIRIKSYYEEDERILLLNFFKLINQHYDTNDCYLCAHNGKEFDFPYLCRRAIIHEIKIPSILQVHFKKPWEMQLLDTMSMWKFGDYKSYTSLELLAHIFNIPTPKDDIDGSMVNEVFWKEKNIKRISEYCQKDVVTLIQVFLRLLGRDNISNIEVSYV